MMQLKKLLQPFQKINMMLNWFCCNKNGKQKKYHTVGTDPKPKEKS